MTARLASAPSALVCCASPLQVLNGIEALVNLQIESSLAHLVLFHGGSKKSLQQQLEISSFVKWGKVTLVSFPVNLRNAWNVRRFNSLINASRNSPLCILGDYRSDEMKHVGHYLRIARIVLLDDGNATVEIAQQRTNPAGTPRRLRSVLARYLVGYRIGDLPKVTYFTVYELVDSPRDEVITNSYVWLRKRIGAQELSPIIYFLGCPLIEAKSVSDLIDNTHYLKLLSDAVTHLKAEFPQLRVVYISHRRETPEKLDLIRASGFEVVDFNSPIEIILANAKKRPSVIATFYSAAMDTLYSIFGSQIAFRSFQLPNEFVRYQIANSVQQYYDYYVANYSLNFKVISVDSYVE